MSAGLLVRYFTSGSDLHGRLVAETTGAGLMVCMRWFANSGQLCLMSRYDELLMLVCKLMLNVHMEWGKWVVPSLWVCLWSTANVPRHSTAHLCRTFFFLVCF
jgi:hypothetical protein